MSKACLVGITSLKHMSLISIYENLLNDNKVDFDLINTENDENVTTYAKKHYKYQGSQFKVLRHLGFLKFFLKICLSQNYERIIVWNTQTALLISPVLFFKKNKYIINIRDYSYENHMILRFILKYLYKNAAFNTISSDGFRKFLPLNSEYHTMHSLNFNLLHQIPTVKRKAKSEVININFIGYNRFNNISKKVIEAFKSDRRFHLKFIGKGADELKNMVKDEVFDNISFHDTFPFEKTAEFLEDTDILNNIYGNDSIALTTALSIRFNYAVYLGLPILCSNNTYNGEKAESLGIGKVVNFNNISTDDVYNWYHNRNIIIAKEKCNEYLENAELDNEKVAQKILEFL